MREMINIASPVVGEEEIRAVEAVVRSGALAQGKKVEELENSWAKFCGTRYAVALNSGTAALHCALKGVGINNGDEVITTPFSFIATINPIIMLGARPVLVDIKPNNFNIDPALVEAAVTSKTKAILAVDLYGQPFDYDELNKIAEEHRLQLIEDACQSIGSKYGVKKAGTLGAAAAFSLYATKNIMSGEGGILTTDSDAVNRIARSFRQHGMTGPYEYAELGYNYRMTDMSAAIAIEQLKKLEGLNKRRQQNALILDEELKDLPGIEIPFRQSDRTHVYHQYTIRILKDSGLDRSKLQEELKAVNIGSGIYYPKPLHAYPHIQALGYKMGDFPEAEKAAEEVLSLPVHAKVTEEEARYIGQTIRRLING